MKNIENWRASSGSNACQGYPVMIALPQAEDGSVSKEALRTSFLDAYRDRYGHCSDTFPVELVSLPVTVSVDADSLPPLMSMPKEAATNPLKGSRDAYDESVGAMVAHRVYDRYLMAAGFEITGPALIEERETTTVVPAGGRVSVHDNGSLLIEFTR